MNKQLWKQEVGTSVKESSTKPMGLEELDKFLKDFKTKDMSTGWACPKCGKVHAPWVDSCECTVRWVYHPYYPTYYPTHYLPPIVWC